MRPPPRLPVLTVCEALHALNAYRKKDVVIIGRFSSTFEGGLLHERCEEDDRVLLQGHRWLAAIALSAAAEPHAVNDVFPISDVLLREKLNESRDYHSLHQETRENREPWLAVFGTLESPAKLKNHLPPSASNPHNIPGNGYMSNGTVPAAIVVRGQRLVRQDN